MPWNTRCVDIILPCIIQIKGQKNNLNIKTVTMIDHVTGWFEVKQYNNKIEIYQSRTWLKNADV